MQGMCQLHRRDEGAETRNARHQREKCVENTPVPEQFLESRHKMQAARRSRGFFFVAPSDRPARRRFWPEVRGAEVETAATCRRKCHATMPFNVVPSTRVPLHVVVTTVLLPRTCCYRSTCRRTKSSTMLPMRAARCRVRDEVL
jgi:hypothetical protein